MTRSMTPREVWEGAERGEVKILDLRTGVERRRYGAPPGAIPVSFGRPIAVSEPAPAVYLCQHAVRSKLTGRRGAAEVEGGFVAWVEAGLPVERIR